MELDFLRLHARFVDAARRDDELDAQYAIRLAALRLLEGAQTLFQRHPAIEAVGPAIPALQVDGSPIKLAFWGEDDGTTPAAIEAFQAWVDTDPLSPSQHWGKPQLMAVARCVFNYAAEMDGGYTPLTRDNLIHGVLRTVGQEVGREVQAMIDAERLGCDTPPARSPPSLARRRI